MNNYCNKTIYQTSDLALATVLSIYQPIEKIDRTNPGRVNFIFIKNAELENLISRYWDKKLKVEPQTYFQQLKFVKARLYSEG